LDNYLWSQLAEDRLHASFIFDGHHLPPAVMKTMLRAKGLRRCFLVSDSVALAGAAPGTYRAPVGGEVHLGAGGRLSLAGGPYLAGATQPLAVGVGNAMAYAGADMAGAVSLASSNPARLLGLGRREGRGSVRVGAPADLTVFSLDPALGKRLTVEMTVVKGNVVYRRLAS
jgi:N-acetylglucosamine-6-phosphate deacetylase